MGQLTNAGYIPERLDAILVSLDQGFRAIYGDDINTDPDSPDGQMIGLIAQMKADLEELGEAIYRALDPDHAPGAWLEQRVAYAGIMRRGARYSYLRGATLAGTVGTVIQAGALIEDENRIQWQLVADSTIGADRTARADFRSVEPGLFGLAQVSELKILTIFLGWTGVTLNAPAEEGAEEEKDSELRARFRKSRSRPAQNSVDSIEARVGELTDVRQVECLENMTDVVDANGLPAHGINVIVDGGEPADIALVILQNKTAGAPMMGEQEITVVDSKGRQRLVRFDRPTDVDCVAALTVKRSKNFTAIDTDGIKAALAAEDFLVGETVERSRLYTPINTVAGFSVSSFTIGKVGGTLSESDIAIGVREKARFLVGDIEVVVI